MWYKYVFMIIFNILQLFALSLDEIDNSSNSTFNVGLPDVTVMRNTIMLPRVVIISNIW